MRKKPPELVKLLTHHGVTAPPELVALAKTYEEGQVLIGNSLYAPSPFGGAAGQVRSAFVKAYEAGEISDFSEAMVESARNAAIADQLTAIWREAAPKMERIAARIVNAAGDELVAEARPAFDKGVATLAELVGLWGADPDPVAVLASEDDKLVNRYRHEWEGTLAEVTKAAALRPNCLALVSYGDTRLRIYDWLDPDTEWSRPQVAVADSAYGKGRTQHPAEQLAFLIESGFRPRLNTPTEAKTIEEGLRAREEREAKARSRSADEGQGSLVAQARKARQKAGKS